MGDDAAWNSAGLYVLYQVLGWLAFTVWSFSFWPQVTLNYQRKRSVAYFWSRMMGVFGNAKAAVHYSWHIFGNAVDLENWLVWGLALQCSWIAFWLRRLQPHEALFVLDLQCSPLLQPICSTPIPWEIWLWWGTSGIKVKRIFLYLVAVHSVFYMICASKQSGGWVWGIELSINSIGLFCRSQSSMIIHCLFWIQQHNFFPLVVCAWRECLNWMRSNLFWFIEQLFLAPRGMPSQIEFDHQWTNIECSLSKPPHYLQACTKNLTNMEGVICKTINFQSKIKLS